MNRELAELAEMLALEQTTNADLREDVEALAAELRIVTQARDGYAGRLEAMTAEARAGRRAPSGCCARISRS